MRVPLLDLSEQYQNLAEPIRRELDEILRTQNFILGSKVEEFERALAEYCGTKHAVGVSSGTDALLDIFMALGFGPNDTVITSESSLCRYRSGNFQHFDRHDRALPRDVPPQRERGVNRSRGKSR